MGNGAFRAFVVCVDETGEGVSDQGDGFYVLVWVFWGWAFGDGYELVGGEI